MRRRGRARLPAGIERRLATLGAVRETQPAVRFAYLFGRAGRGELRPLSDVDVAVYLDGAADPVQARLELISVVTKHLGTDEVDLVVLNRAPTALLGRILQSRRGSRTRIRSCGIASSHWRSGSSSTSASSSSASWMLASPVVERDLLRRKLAELTEYVGQVSEHRDLTRYRAEWKTQRIVERTLQMAIETCLDIASHVLADRELGVPSTYAETFEILVEASLMSRALVE
jgi:predicted nucleotidyltransferase